MGAKRAEAGHPAPFNLKYLGIGNEDQITPVFRERFQMIFEAVKARHPEITVVGTVGPFASGPDYDNGWAIANELAVPMVDEHYYVPPSWFLTHNDFYDKYDRSRSQVYLGEYAAHDVGRRSTLRSALAEAAYLTGLERNADVVRFASYAPLLGKIGRTRWDPNLIYFTNTRVVPTVNYQVQKLFSVNSGDRYLTTNVVVPGGSDAPVFGTKLFLGTWATQAEFDDVRVTTADGRTLFSDDFANGATAGKQWDGREGRWDVSPDGVYKQTGGNTAATSWIAAPIDAKEYVLTLRAQDRRGGRLRHRLHVDRQRRLLLAEPWRLRQHAARGREVDRRRQGIDGPRRARLDRDRSLVRHPSRSVRSSREVPAGRQGGAGVRRRRIPRVAVALRVGCP
ncbi:MAG: alpha-L-arabinofuranosidase C-terminal domain-containing protein [Tepidisphaeraceae bacterium]